MMTIIFGWLGMILYASIAVFYIGLMKRGEFALIHTLFALTFAMWLPLPLAIYKTEMSEMLLVGTLFGSLYLIMMIITMTLQAGHLAYISGNTEINAKSANHLMTILSSPFEAMANVLKCIWALCLGLAFWANGLKWLALLLFLISLFGVYYLLLVLKASIKKRGTFVDYIKGNVYWSNAETLLLFGSLLCYLTL